MVQARYALALRDAPAGRLRLELRLGEATLGLGEITVAAVERFFAVPPLDQLSNALFGGEIALLGYGLSAGPYAANDVLPLTLHWRAEAPAHARRQGLCPSG